MRPAAARSSLVDHCERTAKWTCRLAVTLGWHGRRLTALCVAAAVHDIGKRLLEPSVLVEPGRLVGEQRAQMQRHPLLGGLFLAGHRHRVGELAPQVALLHHEQWDGGGYPFGLEGERIPPAVRIVSVADVFTALTERRVYRDALDPAEAAELMLMERGRKFDPAVLDAFLRLAF